MQLFYITAVGSGLALIPRLPSDSIDALVTDPPAGISFMNKAWDKFRERDAFVDFITRTALEWYRVLKPGAHGLVWALPRTAHWTTWALEDAGFEIRDKHLHLFGTGFPKGINVGKAIDEKLGAVRQVVQYRAGAIGTIGGTASGTVSDRSDNGATLTAPATAEAARWEGWSTAMKPAYEEWILIRKPLEGTVVDNVLKYGTGALNVDGCRIGYTSDADRASATPQGRVTSKRSGSVGAEPDAGRNLARVEFDRPETTGRWPAHLSLDDEAAAMLDAQSGDVGAAAPVQGDEPSAPIANAYNKRKRVKGAFHADSGGASRFFYVAKAPKRDKTSGGLVTNDHPTAKNTELMRWLVRLITPPGGVVLDSFMGSGSTGAACALEHVSFIGFDLDAHFVDDIATPRIAAAYEATMTGDDAEDTTDIDMLAPTTIPPFLRWVGGKRRQALDLAVRATAALKPGGRYIEPFLGSGAVALAMPPGTPMLLGDACLPLGYLWWWLQQHPREIAEYAAGYGLALDQDWNTQEGFNELRQQHNATPYSDASWEPSARFLWLTSASFNGVYRESSKGEYNVPWGRRARVSVPTPETLEAVAAHIAQAQVFPGWDFEDVIDQAGAGDVVFADSPYDGPKGQFTSYVKTPFDADAQLRLARAAYRARERGATVILTNSDTVRIRDFYAGWTIESALERRPVAADPGRRVPAYCVVISGGPL
ncbi:MAG: Dam family site-specific DNA-(adenine-N6)-methyltransferase [Tessaracoccus sp.]|uniref:Dam family site-specific DNA-(adenine-N6)-methyltransferase n=1 Tax=Tessaracoccus sp. TaxID=1971211 RepID=UPI001ECF52B5|nr:Dam family site-specific DNA-(adenine-N6)-methyltransferase [Tessaracoccus sp.]MBK7823184.1 Dam family site-specific DNA-(adenine-N6)-methyltransferase [Tessaracoccus sp.]